MGTRGPKPKPTTIKRKTGNPGKHRLNDQEPEPTGGLDAPDCLDQYGRQVWFRITGSMPEGVYTRVDEQLLASYCQAASMHRAAVFVNRLGKFKAKERGFITETAYRDTNGRDWLRIQKEQAQALATIGTRLGLDPAARTAIKVPEKKKQGKFGDLRKVS